MMLHLFTCALHHESIKMCAVVDTGRRVGAVVQDIVSVFGTPDVVYPDWSVVRRKSIPACIEARNFKVNINNTETITGR